MDDLPLHKVTKNKRGIVIIQYKTPPRLEAFIAIYKHANIECIVITVSKTGIPIHCPIG